MKYNFADIPEGSPVVLMLHSGTMHMRMDATIVSLIREDIAIINLHTQVNSIIKFDNVRIEVTYTTLRGIPYVWKNAQIVYFKDNYIMQVKGEGHRFNRRSTFRVGISRTGRMRTPDGREQQAIIRDVSLSGFSITDRYNEYNFKMGDNITLYFEDIGHVLDLFGKVVRIDEKEHSTVYGFAIIRSCKDLSSYIATKQRRKRSNLPPSYVLPSPSEQ